MEMKLFCLTLLIFNGITDSRSEQFEVVGPAGPVVAISGEDVILSCSVKPNISVVDMRVEWFRVDLKDSQLVHLYENHKDKNTDQIQSYRGRTELINQELQRGNASLKLSSVQVSDEGLYKCFIQSKSWYDDATVNVSVEAVGSPPVISVDGFDHLGRLHLQCESEGWYPEPDLEWLDRGGVSLSSETMETHRNTDRFSVKHTITVHHSDHYHCRVKLRHHILEALIITTSKTLNILRVYIICVSVPSVVVIAGILKTVFDCFKKNRDKEQSKNVRLIEMGTIETDISDLENDKTRIQADISYLKTVKTRMSADVLNLKNMTTNMLADLQNKKTRIQAVLSHLRTHTVNVILDADTAHPYLIVSDGGKHVKIGNSKPNKEMKDEEQNAQPKEEEIGHEEQNAKLKEEDIGDEEQNTKLKEEDIGDEDQNTKLKEEKIGDEEQNAKLKEEDIGDEEQNPKLKEEETGDEEQNTKLKEEETGDEDQNTKLKEEDIGDEEQNTKLKEEETGDEEQNTKLKEEETGDEEQNTKPKEEMEGMKEQNNKFEKYLGVLGKDGFSSGSFYYEVQVKGQTEWDLGVTTESVNKKELFTLNPENRCWTVSHRNETDQEFGTPIDSFVSSMKFEKVGVFVDYEEGLVSFYDVESMSHIHSYIGQSFNEKLYPFFGLGLLWNENTAPLIISPVILKSNLTKK